MGTKSNRPFAIVTGASTGIGFYLAKCCAKAGFDLLIAADEAAIGAAAEELGEIGVLVDSIQTDLSTTGGWTS